MRLREEIRLAVGVVLALQVFTLLGAVGLLSRMSPAVERILSENEYSMHAAEQMMVALLRDDLAKSERVRNFEVALRQAESNVTEDEEPAVLQRLEDVHAAAITGDAEARRAAVEALTALTAINRQSMRVADARARELGVAGAWAAVLMGVLSFGGSLVLMRRLDRNISQPLLEIRSALDALHTGNSLRRCHLARGAHELREIAESVDRLLSEHFDRAAKDWHADAAADRALAIDLLDRLGHPAWVLADDGSVRLANEAGLEELLRNDEVAPRLSRVVAPQASETSEDRLGMTVQRLRAGGALVHAETRKRG